MSITLLPFTQHDFVRLISWLANEKELKQWAGPAMFTWPLDQEQLGR